MLPKAERVMQITGMLITLQLLRIGFKYILFAFTGRTLMSDVIVSAVLMLALSAVIKIISKVNGVRLSVFPAKFRVLYISATIIAAALLASNLFFISRTYDLLFLAYTVVITPLFEELIFRGYVWNRLNEVFDKELITYIMSSVLFALWHIGYIDSVAFRMTGSENLAFIMYMKVITGLAFGVIIGALRYKTKNCYSAMLLHGVMNIFGK
jgi:membrane protease YdiL (CAAX protease family)